MTPEEKLNFDILCPATKQKRLIRFWYQDESDKKNKPQWRTVEPHLIGLRSNKDISKQTVQLSGWVRLSAADNIDDVMDGKQDGWKNYKLRGISKIQLLDKTYVHTRYGYNPTDTNMVEIYCRTQVA